jgi:hypothetical protein
VFLAYVDGSGETNKHCRIGVYAAVLIPDDEFFGLETMAGLAVDMLIPEDKLDKFEEFKASDLYRQKGVFEDAKPEDCFRIIDATLSALLKYRGGTISVVYGAVNKDRLEEHDAASANPADIAFRLCLKAIEKWLIVEEQRIISMTPGPTESPMALVIADDDQVLKGRLQETFRNLRRQIRRPHLDDLYFGDSRYSLGIQMADLCAYFIGLHLVGGDQQAEQFYDLFKGNIHCGDVFPPERHKEVSA